MRQISLRIPDHLSAALKDVATTRGESVNAYATAVLSAAVDPDLTDDESERLQARLARAGLLAQEGGQARTRPSRARVQEARSRAGRGRQLSELIDEGRG